MTNTALKPKTMILTLGLLLSLSVITQPGNAQNNSDGWFTVQPVANEKAINVFVQSPSQEKYDVKLFGADGEVVWQSRNTNGAFKKSLMFNDLADGHYTISVSKGDIAVEQPIHVKASGVTVEENLRYISGPTVAVVGKLVMVDFPATGESSEVEVEIYDSRGQEVFANAITSNGKRVTQYDMTALPTGKYEMRFTNGVSSFTKTVNLKAE